MALSGISIQRFKELRKNMRLANIYEKDIEESFIRSSGPGGQNVNKVSTCVALYHRPTEIRVKSQQERTQGLNRYIARCLLLAKIEQHQRLLRQLAVHEREKKRRQNRKRTYAQKEKILVGKRRRSEKKEFRRKVRPYKLGE